MLSDKINNWNQLSNLKADKIALDKLSFKNVVLINSFCNNSLRKSFSTSTLSSRISSAKTSSDSSLSFNSKFSSNTNNSNQSVPPNFILTKDARNRNFIVGSVNHHASLLGYEEFERFFPNSMLSIAIITWNMCGRIPKTSTLANLLLPEKMYYLPDLYVIGVQEAPYSNSHEKKEWEILLQSTIGTEHVVLHSSNLGVLHLIIFIRKHLIWYTSLPEHSSINSKNSATNMIKTKGALAICLNIFGSSLLFINCHFPAHEKRYKQRLEEYNRICTQLNLPRNHKNLASKYISKNVTNRFDYVFWFGDLNFRIERNQENMIKDLSHLNNSDYTSLLQHDQLSKAINKNEIFSKFVESNIKFLPTYKYLIGTNNFDDLGNRVPSWTDRILYKTKCDRNLVNCIEYNSVSDLDTSDHKPVFALMNIKIKPGKDNNILLNAGLFERDIYLAGIKKRREMWNEMKVCNKKSLFSSAPRSNCNLS